jgi:AcrR family transcriptional regulator
MTTPRTVPRAPRKRAGRYHHGDLRTALIQAALRTIQRTGVGALTLRGVSADLGVSRTALYRHFASKTALLAAVAREGFGKLAGELRAGWDAGGGGTAGFEAMGLAYVRFALDNPSHYRVMFGGFLDQQKCDPGLADKGANAFQVLVEAIVAQQRDGILRRDDPEQAALFVWALVHGVAMLAIDGQLPPDRVDVEALCRFAFARLRSGVAPDAASAARA